LITRDGLTKEEMTIEKVVELLLERLA